MIIFFILLSLSSSYLLYVNRSKESNESIFLSMIYGLLVIHMLTAISVTNELSQTISAIIFVHTSPILFLIGPAFYFYSLALINPSFKLTKSHLIHLIPFVISFIAILPYCRLPWEVKVKLLENIKLNRTLIRDIPLFNFNLGLIYLIRPVITFFYLAIVSFQFFKNWNILSKIYSPFKTKLLKRWIWLFLILLLIANFSNLIFQIMVYVNSVHIGFLLFPIISFTSIAILGFQLFFNPYIMYGFNHLRFYSNDSLLAKLYLIGDEKKYSLEVMDELKLKVDQYKLNHPYLKQGFTINQMSNEMGISLNKLQYYFKNVYHDSFSNWKNKKRIEYAINLINDDFLKRYTIEELSKNCGYRSRSNFNDAMKKYSKN